MSHYQQELDAVQADPRLAVWPAALAQTPVSVASPHQAPVTMSAHEFVDFWRPLVGVFHIDQQGETIDVLHAGAVYRWVGDYSSAAWHAHAPQDRAQTAVTRKWVADLVHLPQYRAATSKAARDRVALAHLPALQTAVDGEHDTLRNKDGWKILTEANQRAEQLRAQAYQPLLADQQALHDLLAADTEFATATNDTHRRVRIKDVLMPKADGWAPDAETVAVLISGRTRTTARERKARRTKSAKGTKNA